MEKYKTSEWKRPVKLKEGMNFEGKKYKIIERDMVNDSDLVRHSPPKIARMIADFVENKVN